MLIVFLESTCICLKKMVSELSKQKRCQHHHHLTSLKVMVATPILKSQALTSSFVVNMPVGSRCAKTEAWRGMSLFQKKNSR